MRIRIHRLSIALMLLIVGVVSMAVLVAQAPSSGATPPSTITRGNTEAAVNAAAAAARADAALEEWQAPRTAWGDPDLRGLWMTATYTPLERPEELGAQAFYTEEEAFAEFKNAADADATVDTRTMHYDWKEFGMEAWQSGARPNLRTSLIVDPDNGRLPPLTPEAQERRAAVAAAARERNPSISVRTFGNLYTRCVQGLGAVPLVSGGNPGADSAARAAGVTAEVLLFQSPGYVTILLQSNNDVRIVPLAGRPALPSHVRNWLGEPRGSWDGDTLVVETANFIDKTPGTNFLGSTDALRVTERFTRIGPNTVHYEYTVTDPNTWTRPWSVDTLLPRVEPGTFYEFACHEHSYGLINVVTGTQIRERESNEVDASEGGPSTYPAYLLR